MIRKVLIETALILCMTVVPIYTFVHAVRAGLIQFEDADRRFQEIKKKHYGFLND
jgi:nitrogen fixation-related uncharacterized protein